MLLGTMMLLRDRFEPNWKLTSVGPMVLNERLFDVGIGF